MQEKKKTKKTTKNKKKLPRRTKNKTHTTQPHYRQRLSAHNPR